MRYIIKNISIIAFHEVSHSYIANQYILLFLKWTEIGYVFRAVCAAAALPKIKYY